MRSFLLLSFLAMPTLAFASESFTFESAEIAQLLPGQRADRAVQMLGDIPQLQRNHSYSIVITNGGDVGLIDFHAGKSRFRFARIDLENGRVEFGRYNGLQKNKFQNHREAIKFESVAFQSDYVDQQQIERNTLHIKFISTVDAPELSEYAFWQMHRVAHEREEPTAQEQPPTKKRKKDSNISADRPQEGEKLGMLAQAAEKTRAETVSETPTSIERLGESQQFEPFLARAVSPTALEQLRQISMTAPSVVNYSNGPATQIYYRLEPVNYLTPYGYVQVMQQVPYEVPYPVPQLPTIEADPNPYPFSFQAAGK